uniref:Leucine-rich repeat-containing protein 15 n=1 Tax=Ditylenchus dipsaci TaxID=166011 RepID=A0A915DDW2_9BILA
MRMSRFSINTSFVISFLLLRCHSTAQPNNSTLVDPCAKIEESFQKATTEPGAEPACRCLPHGFEAFGVQDHILLSQDPQNNGIWIGCTQQSMPAVFRALNSLNETISISQMWIWNSLFSILPNNLFANVRPNTLAIENSAVSVFRKGAFSNMKHLKNLRLKNNILKTIESKTFSDLDSLHSLDLSGNKLMALKQGHFDELRQLETLMLSGNQIVSIQDGTFNSLTNVKTLNLENNRLVNITKNTFRGLTNLEVLNLNGNQIAWIDNDAFSEMRHLRNLDLGSNQISELQISNLPALKRLYINKNRVQSLQRVALKELTGLSLLNVDRNKITKVEQQDLSCLHKSPLISLSLAENNITGLECGAFDALPHLTVLSLQHNLLSTLSCTLVGPQGSALIQSILRPLQKLRNLFLSNNLIEIVENGDLNILTSLKSLSLDHNKITKIRRNALKGLGNLTSLFLNTNHLYYLPEGVFDSLNAEKMKSVDLSDNPWECVCEKEWIGKWLTKLATGCKNEVDLKVVEDVPEEPDHSLWITIIASILAVVALVFLVIASYVYMQSNCYPPVPLKNMPQDMMRLIPSQESLLSFPNPIATSDLLKQPPPPMLPISITIKDFEKPDFCGVTQQGLTAAAGDKKRVRFA